MAALQAPMQALALAAGPAGLGSARPLARGTVVCVVGRGQLAQLRGSGRAQARLLQSAGRERSRRRSVSAQALSGLELAPGGPVAIIADANRAVGDVGLALELSVQLSYLLTLLALLAAGSFLVVRQVLVRNELESAAKALGDRVRDGTASSQDYYEMGCIMLRKKVFTQAIRNLQQAEVAWDGTDGDLAGLYNAMGFAYQSQGKPQVALDNYKKAIALQPGYVIALKNMGDVLEAEKRYQEALDMYERVAAVAPDDKIARERIGFLRTRLQRLGA